MRTLLVLCATILLVGACSDKEAEKACFEAIKRYQNAMSSDDFRKTGFADPVFDDLLAVAKKYENSSVMQCQAMQKFAAAITEGRSKMAPAPAPTPAPPAETGAPPTGAPPPPARGQGDDIIQTPTSAPAQPAK